MLPFVHIQAQSHVLSTLKSSHFAYPTTEQIQMTLAAVSSIATRYLPRLIGIKFHMTKSPHNMCQYIKNADISLTSFFHMCQKQNAHYISHICQTYDVTSNKHVTGNTVQILFANYMSCYWHISMKKYDSHTVDIACMPSFYSAISFHHCCIYVLKQN